MNPDVARALVCTLGCGMGGWGGAGRGSQAVVERIVGPKEGIATQECMFLKRWHGVGTREEHSGPVLAHSQELRLRTP